VARCAADGDLIRMRRRGEFKTPGGKLIAVDFDVVDDELRNVVVTGDFFLYPEEALSVLSGALENCPATLDKAGYAARVRTALDSSGELVGSSPEALAAAVVSALGAQPAPEQDDRG
jgi:lipoate-protein ligase A